MITDYEFELEGGTGVPDDIEEVEGVEIAVRGGAGTVSVVYGDAELLEAAWRCLELLARAGYRIHDVQRGRWVDVDEDYEYVLDTYAAMQRLPSR